MKNLNKVCFILCLICIMILATSIDIIGQYKDKGTNVPGIIGLSALPASFIIAEINYSNFVGKFGDREGYMQGSKLRSYESMMDQNESIIITGALVTVAGIVIQHFINVKHSDRNKRCYN